MTESVWNYPRPPKVEPTDREVIVVHRGVEIARSVRAVRVLETSHPPVFYLPPDDVRTDLFLPNGHRTFCEYKGTAAYVDLSIGDVVVSRTAWFYPDPTVGYRAITGFYAFYPSPPLTRSPTSPASGSSG